MNAHTDTKMPALMTGGHVNAIIPQSIEEMWRVSTMVVSAGLAPAALVGKKTGNDAASAVAIAVMAGAELGLPPMVALRSFTVIGGRPALYGDGIINVARRSKKAEYIRTGYDEARKAGWCEARRSDTGEEKRVEFSVDDAKRAGLWDDRTTVRRKGYDGQWKDAPNDAPWFRYPQRMLAWRAAGYCLRELFADVLGGITDEFEAREIAGEPEMRDVTPKAPTPPPPPPPPSNAKDAVEDAETIDEEGPSGSSSDLDLGTFMHELDEALALQNDEAGVEEIWNEFDPESTLESAGHTDLVEVARSMKANRLEAIATGAEA